MLTDGGTLHRRAVPSRMARPRSATWGALLACGIALTAVDRLVPGVGMGPAYIPLIALAGWRLGPFAACGVAAAAAVLNVVPALPGEDALPAALAAARAFLRLGTYAFVVVGTCALRRAYDRERAAARRDALTGVMNRTAFEEHAGAALVAGGLDGRLRILAVADLDGFKAVNDAAGHAAGDETLRRFATAASACLADGEAIARLGGDEFVLFLEARNAAAALDRVEDVHRRIGAELAGSGLGVSLGAVVLVGGHGLCAGLRDADALMYAAKAAGKGRCLFGPAKPAPPVPTDRTTAGTLALA